MKKITRRTVLRVSGLAAASLALSGCGARQGHADSAALQVAATTYPVYLLTQAVTEGIDGVVLDPWSNSASLDGALLNGLLHAGHTPEGPGAEETEAGKEAARAGHWAAAAECYQKAAEQGNSAGLSLLGECLYQGRGVPKSAAQARKLWKAAAESGETIALLNLGDDCAARGDNGKALLWYRRARQSAAAVPDIEYTPRVCLRLAQFETRYTSRKKALAQAAEHRVVADGFNSNATFQILAREHLCRLI